MKKRKAIRDNGYENSKNGTLYSKISTNYQFNRLYFCIVKKQDTMKKN